MKFSMTGQEKGGFNTDDCLIEVTSWADLTILTTLFQYIVTLKGKQDLIYILNAFLNCHIYYFG